MGSRQGQRSAGPDQAGLGRLIVLRLIRPKGEDRAGPVAGQIVYQSVSEAKVNNVLFKQSKVMNMVTRALVLTGLLGFSVTVAWAQSGSDRVADNLAPIGDVCLAGDPCSAAPAAAAPAAAPAPAPVVAAPAAAAPAPAAEPAADNFDVAGAYQLRCFACHGTGAAGAPVIGNAEAWGERMAKGMDAVMANAINGIGAMPARGLCMDCTDDQIAALINYMVDGGQ